MLRELPKEFKDIIKQYYYQKGFVGFLDGLYIGDNKEVRGTGIALFDSIENKSNKYIWDIQMMVFEYQEKYNLDDDELMVCSSLEGKGISLFYEDLKFIDKEEFFNAIS